MPDYDYFTAIHDQTHDGMRPTPASRGAVSLPVPGEQYQVTFCCRDQLVGHNVTYIGENHHGESMIELANGEQIRGVYDFAELSR
jgi:hypothetical protein